MPKIMLTPEALESASSSIASCREKQQDLISQVGKVIADLVSGWEGAAQSAFTAAYDRRKGTYAQFAPDLTAFSAFLSSYADTMRAIDTGKAQEIQ